MRLPGQLVVNEEKQHLLARVYNSVLLYPFQYSLFFSEPNGS